MIPGTFNMCAGEPPNWCGTQSSCTEGMRQYRQYNRDFVRILSSQQIARLSWPNTVLEQISYCSAKMLLYPTRSALRGAQSLDPLANYSRENNKLAEGRTWLWAANCLGPTTAVQCIHTTRRTPESHKKPAPRTHTCTRLFLCCACASCFLIEQSFQAKRPRLHCAQQLRCCTADQHSSGTRLLTSCGNVSWPDRTMRLTLRPRVVGVGSNMYSRFSTSCSVAGVATSPASLSCTTCGCWLDKPLLRLGSAHISDALMGPAERDRLVGLAFPGKRHRQTRLCRKLAAYALLAACWIIPCLAVPVTCWNKVLRGLRRMYTEEMSFGGEV